MSAAPLIP